MSRRDNVVNALLGIFLLVVFFACLAAIAVVCLAGFIGLEWVVRRIVPGLTHPFDFTIIAICALGMAWYGVRHARQGRWKNAFLHFAMAPIMGWALVIAHQSSIGGVRGNWVLGCWLPLVIVMSIAGDTTIGRLKFLLASAIICALVLVNSGLLGNTAMAHTVADSLFGVTIVWLGIDIIRNRYKTEAPNPPMALPPTAA